mgnify:FL=1
MVRLFMVFVLALSLVICPVMVCAIDSEATRATIKHLQGVYVVIEDLQPNIAKHQKLIAKAGIEKGKLQAMVEERLKKAGLKVFTREEWLQAPGRPLLCITINSHESEKYTYAYDVNIQLMQIVLLEANPQARSMSPTWSINMTGMANIGNLYIIREATLTLIDRFISAWKN